MNEQELKQTVAKNLIYYRKLNGYTQLELAEKLNYSDKSVSKWERAEGMPDVYTLTELAELYRITVNDLLSASARKRPPALQPHRYLICAMSCGLVWLVAVIIYVSFRIFAPQYDSVIWLTFIYAVPASAIVLTVFAGVWKVRWCCAIGVSLIIWGVSLALYYSVPLDQMLLIFLVAIFLQILTVMWFFFRKIVQKFRKP